MQTVPLLRQLTGMLTGAVLAVAGLGASASANPSLLFDVKTGEVLQHDRAFQRWHPASLTKLMTAYVTFRAVKDGELALNSPIKVSKNSAAEPPSKMGYKAGQVMSLDNALKMMLIKSANDIATAVAENVGGTEKAFVDRMNAEAARLGMADSHFVNANGLHSPLQFITARDLGILVMAIRNEFPEYAPLFSIEGLQAGKKVLKSYNLLVGRYAGADGMKTGFVCASGFNMIGSATRGDRTLAVVVLGRDSADGRTQVAADLLNQGFAAARSGNVVLATMAADTDRAAPPVDMREAICGKKPAAAQSEAAGEHEKQTKKSPWLEDLDHPIRLATVGLGGATGPIPKARLDMEGKEFADVPIPTPRPDYTPIDEAKASMQGDAAAN